SGLRVFVSAKATGRDPEGGVAARWRAGPATAALSFPFGLPTRGPDDEGAGAAGAMLFSGERDKDTAGPCGRGVEEGKGTAWRGTYQETTASVASMSAPPSTTARLARFTLERARTAAIAAA